MRTTWSVLAGPTEKTAYAGISPLYDKWCSGDPAYEQTKKFYLSELSRREGPFLELGVGTGRLARELVQRRAVDVTGVDICPEMLSICEAAYRRQKEMGCPGSLRLELRDMTELPYREEFRTAYLPFRTVGHLLTVDALAAMFQGVYRALKPGGVFLLDHYMFDRAWAREHQDQDLPMYRDDTVKIEDHYLYHFEDGYMDCSIKVNGAAVDGFRFRWYSKECLGQAAEKAGFVLERLIGEFDGSVWDQGSGNQIWIWKKPGVSISDMKKDLVYESLRDENRPTELSHRG